MNETLSSEDDCSSASSSSSTSEDEEDDHHDGNHHIDGTDESPEEERRVGTGENFRGNMPGTTFSSNRVQYPASTGKGRGSANVVQQVTTVVPHRKDVLLGRGRPYQNFTGNRRMLRIVSRYKEEYSTRPRDQKRLFVETVLDAVLQDGTRFLRRVDENDDGSDQWEEVNRTTAAEKVWHALRSKGRSMKSKEHTRGSRDSGTTNQEGNNGEEEQSFISHSSGFNHERNHQQQQQQQQQQYVQVSSNATSSSNGIGGEFLDSNISSQHAAVHQRSQAERASPSTSIMPTIESLSREIMQHLNNAVAATNLLSALVGAPLQVPTAPSPIMMVVGAPSTVGGPHVVGMPTQHSSAPTDVGMMNHHHELLRAASQVAPPPPVGPPPPMNNRAPPSQMFPFTNLAGIAPSLSATNYPSSLQYAGGGGGGVGVGNTMGTVSLPPQLQAALQAAQMAALYPRLYMGGDPPTTVQSTPNTVPNSTNHNQSNVDRNHQILLQALAALSRQSMQQGTTPPPMPP